MTRPKKTTCKKCKSPLRTTRESKASRPDTKQHAGFGYCSGCRGHLERHGIPLTPADPHVLAGLNNYLRRRHQRLNPGRTV